MKTHAPVTPVKRRLQGASASSDSGGTSDRATTPPPRFCRRRLLASPLLLLLALMLIFTTTSAVSATAVNVTSINSMNAARLHRRATANCGNGILDDGEECDYGIPGSYECCTRDCRRRTDLLTTCMRGDGVCSRGTCITRNAQCALFDGTVLAVANHSYAGPFKACENDGNIDRTCSLSCAGKGRSGRKCIDLSAYTNVESQVADGLLCGDQRSGSPMGVCLGAHCNPTACRRFRCTANGDCFRNSYGKMQCRCDAPYSGDQCNIRPDCIGFVDACGVCNGNCVIDPQGVMSEVEPNFFTTNTFRFIVLPVASATILCIAILGFVVARHRKKQLQKTKSLASLASSASLSNKIRGFSSAPHKLGISVSWDEYRCIQTHVPQMPDELELQEGDIIFKLLEFDDGWAKGYNTRTQEEGIYPVAFSEKFSPEIRPGSVVGARPASASMRTASNFGVDHKTVA